MGLQLLYHPWLCDKLAEDEGPSSLVHDPCSCVSVSPPVVQTLCGTSFLVDYRDEVLSKIVNICSHNNYQYITNFEW